MKNFTDTGNKYQVGQIVYAKADPSTKLVVRRYIQKIYYCTVHLKPTVKDLTYFERELK